MDGFKLEYGCDPHEMRTIAKSKGLTPDEIKLLELKFCKRYTNARLQIAFPHIGSRTSLWRAAKAAKEKFEKF